MPQELLKNSEKRSCKSKPKFYSKSKEKRPTIPEVAELYYTLESPEKNNTANQKLKEEKMKCIDKTYKPEIGKAKIKVYEPYQESVKLNLEKNKEKDHKIETFSNHKDKLLEPEKKTSKRKEKIDQKHLFQNIANKNNNGKNISEGYLKDSKELLSTKLNRTSTIETNLQITKVNNVSNLKLQYQKANSDKNKESKIDSPAKNECSKIDIGKDDTLNIKWNLKSIPEIICNDDINLEKNTQSTKELEDNTPIEEGYQKFIKRKNKIIINKIGNN
ncbi:5911_t:CDS:2, partial [Gigaspora margarita]